MWNGEWQKTQLNMGEMVCCISNFTDSPQSFKSYCTKKLGDLVSLDDKISSFRPSNFWSFNNVHASGYRLLYHCSRSHFFWGSLRVYHAFPNCAHVLHWALHDVDQRTCRLVISRLLSKLFCKIRISAISLKLWNKVSQTDIISSRLLFSNFRLHQQLVPVHYLLLAANSNTNRESKAQVLVRWSSFWSKG